MVKQIYYNVYFWNYNKPRGLILSKYTEILTCQMMILWGLVQYELYFPIPGNFLCASSFPKPTAHVNQKLLTGIQDATYCLKLIFSSKKRQIPFRFKPHVLISSYFLFFFRRFLQPQWVNQTKSVSPPCENLMCSEACNRQMLISHDSSSSMVGGESHRSPCLLSPSS